MKYSGFAPKSSLLFPPNTVSGVPATSLTCQYDKFLNTPKQVIAYSARQKKNEQAGVL